MLTTVLDRLTTLASKHFVIGAFVPVLFFAAVNGALLYAQFGWFRRWADPQMSASLRAFDAALMFIALSVAAYVLWSINGYLRQVLEGRHIGPDSLLDSPFRRRQLKMFEAHFQRYVKARDVVLSITRGRWTKRLTDAAVKGRGAFPKVNRYDPASPAGVALRTLREIRANAERPAQRDLLAALTAFEAVLASNDVSVEDAGGPSALARDRRELLTLFDYAAGEWEAVEVAAANYLQARFGGRPVAPTSLGNVAKSMEAYAMTRYRLNLGTFWSRLQPVLQKHPDFYGMLQDAKVQLDFLVSFVWLSAATTLVWWIVFLVTRGSWPLFLSVAILGPVSAWLAYRAAVENYVAFGEIVRTGVDLYRFELLDALHVARPSRLGDERTTWEALRGIAANGQESIDISYREAKAGE